MLAPKSQHQKLRRAKLKAIAMGEIPMSAMSLLDTVASKFDKKL